MPRDDRFSIIELPYLLLNLNPVMASPDSFCRDVAIPKGDAGYIIGRLPHYATPNIFGVAPFAMKAG